MGVGMCAGGSPDCPFNAQIDAVEASVNAMLEAAKACGDDAMKNEVVPSDTNGMMYSTSISDEKVKAFDASFAAVKSAVANLLNAEAEGSSFKKEFDKVATSPEFAKLAEVVKAEVGPEEAKLAEDVKGVWGCMKGSVTISDWANKTEFIQTIAAVEPMAEKYLNGDIVAFVDLINYMAA